MSAHKLVVISMDALVREDIEYLADKPSFSYLLKNGSRVDRLKSVYPTVTYACHTTMATGCYPDKHGIVNNTFDVTEEKPPWIHEHRFVRCRDIFDAAKDGKYTTASVGWPVTGHHESVHYLVNECWPTPDGDIEKYEEAYIENGTPRALFDEVVRPYLPMRVGRKQPDSSYFLVKVTADILKKYKPDFLMLHFGQVDSFRHKTGVFSPKVTEGLDQCEEMLTMLFDAAKEAGTFENTNWVVTADHGQLNVTKKVCLNALLRERGFIETDNEGNVLSWRAYAFASEMSAQVHVKEEKDKAEVYDILKEAMDSGLWGISKIYTKDEAAKEHLQGEFEFVLETDGATAFINRAVPPFAEPSASVLTGLCEGNHGYHPDKGPRPPFLACGPDIQKGIVLKEGRLIDGAPTYAKILGVELPDADGTAFNDLLR